MSFRWLTPLLLLFLSGISGIAVASGGLGSSGHKYLPPASFTPSYDLDGNPLDDGEWSYTWDAENRLTTATRTTRAQAAGAPYRRLEYDYDSQSRLYERQEFHGSTGPPLQTERYLYDGWNRILTLDGGNSVLQKMVWGSDASGTDQGAGGVSGLLWIEDEGAAQIHLACADGNGNITALVDAVTRVITARYDYNPFGEVIRQTGAYAAQNPFRFSTKPQDATTGLFYYGYRWFDSETCAWLGKDPLGEEGGLHLYLFVRNDPINGIDYLGMLTFGEWTGIIGESFAYMGTGEYWGEVGHNYAQVGKGIKNGAVGAVEGIANLPELAEFVASGEAVEMADRLRNDPAYQKEFAERMGAGFCELLAKLQSNDGAFEASGEVLFGVASEAAVLKALKIAKELKRLLPNRGPKRVAGAADDVPFTFRGDSRAPSEIFQNGFQPRGTSNDLLLHAQDNLSPPSNFVSTSSSFDVARGFADNIFVVRPRNGINVNQTLGPRSPFPNELEIAIPGGVGPSDIRGVTIPSQGVSHINPNFRR